MNARNDGGPAFPHVEDFTPDGSIIPMSPGMALRDYFAAQALATIAAYPTEDVGTWAPEHFAGHVYAIADAMLAERSKP